MMWPCLCGAYLACGCAKALKADLDAREKRKGKTPGVNKTAAALAQKSALRNTLADGGKSTTADARKEAARLDVVAERASRDLVAGGWRILKPRGDKD